MSQWRRLFLKSFVAALVVLAAAVAHAEKPAPTYSDISYGPHQRDVMDVWIADRDEPTPLVIFIHGGGFSQGSKRGASEKYIKKCLENGISYVAINYPYYKDVALDGILKDHIARAVQFARFNSEEWNIDKSRVAVYGQSAGAGSSLWLAVHDDMADPDAEDPVRRESTRVSAAGCIAVQATYDLPRWRVLFKNVLPPATMKGWELIMGQVMLDMYHLDSEKQVLSEKFKPVRRDLDMMGMMDAGDAPAILQTFASQLQGGEGGDILHHPRHPQAVKERCDQKGMECVLVLDETPEDERVDVMDFLLEHLGVEIN